MIASAVVAYLIGGLPFGYFFVRLSLGKDVRTMGSGNIGATNVHRTAGRKAGLIVLLLDICKGFLATWLTVLIGHNDAAAAAVGVFALMLGHCYPILLGFKGGKAVACFIGAFLFLAPVALLVTTIFFLLVFAATRFVSLASITGAVVFPPIFWFTYHPAPSLLVSAIGSALLIIYRHRANIERLRSGTENVFSLKGGTVK